MKRSDESSSPNLTSENVKASACCLFRDTAYLWNMNSSSDPKTREVRDTLKGGLGKKEVQNFGYSSA